MSENYKKSDLDQFDKIIANKKTDLKNDEYSIKDAIEKSKQVKVGFYECPVYITTARGGTYVFTAGLKMESEEPDAELNWILSGVGLFMQPE